MIEDPVLVPECTDHAVEGGDQSGVTGGVEVLPAIFALEDFEFVARRGEASRGILRIGLSIEDGDHRVLEVMCLFGVRSGCCVVRQARLLDGWLYTRLCPSETGLG
jgi:hypothetical protein